MHGATSILFLGFRWKRRGFQKRSNRFDVKSTKSNVAAAFLVHTITLVRYRIQGVHARKYDARTKHARPDIHKYDCYSAVLGTRVSCVHVKLTFESIKPYIKKKKKIRAHVYSRTLVF